MGDMPDTAMATNEVIDHRVAFLRTWFFNRTDSVVALVPDEKKPMRAVVRDEKHLLFHLHAHVLGHGVHVYWGHDEKKDPEKKATEWGPRIGSYCPATDGSTRFLCIDIDGALKPGGKEHAYPLADPLGAANTIMGRLRDHGASGYLERSGGGDGFHVWVFFDPPASATLARELGLAVAPGDAMLVRPDKAGNGTADPESGRGIEVFPKQTTVANGGFGHCVYLPFWHASPRNTFVDAKGEQLAELPAFIACDPGSLQVAHRTAIEAKRAATTPSPSPQARDDHAGWRRDALARLDLHAVYGELLTGKVTSDGWLEARDPESPTGDRDPSAGVADTTTKAERGYWSSFRDTRGKSVFDWLVDRGLCIDFAAARARIAELTAVPIPGKQRLRSSSGGNGSQGSTSRSPSTTTKPATTASTRGPAARPVSEFKLETYDEILALPDQQWLVEDYLPLGAVAVFWGDHSSFKSFWCLELIRCVMTEEKWCGKEVMNGPCVYVAAEGGQGVKQRIIALVQRGSGGAAVPLDDVKRNLRVLRRPVRLLVEDEVAAFVKAVLGQMPPRDAVREAQKAARAAGDRQDSPAATPTPAPPVGLGPENPVLVVLDTLSACIAGSKELNDDMALCIEAAKAIRDETGATVLIVHHAGHDKSKGHHRGGVSLVSNADIEINVQRVEGRDHVVRVVNPKQRDEKESEGLEFEFHVVEAGRRPNGKAITSGILSFLGKASAEGRSKEKDGENHRKILRALRDAGRGAILSTTQIKEATGLTDGTLFRRLAELSEAGKVLRATPKDGKVRDTPMPGKGWFYWLPEAA